MGPNLPTFFLKHIGRQNGEVIVQALQHTETGSDIVKVEGLNGPNVKVEGL